MCYNASRNAETKKIALKLKRSLAKIAHIKPQMFINGFSFPELPVATINNKTDLESAFWGFVPSYIKSDGEAKTFRLKYLTLNAKSETVFTLPTFKNAILSRRCLIPATGFFEHRHIDAKGKNKIPYYIRSTEDDIFCFAGIYNDYVNEQGILKSTCAILTTEANPLMQKIHNSKMRQPLILPLNMEDVWLDPGLTASDIKDLFKVFDENKMHAHPIKKYNAKDIDPFDTTVIEPMVYDEIND
jgi:putative SOS response-associated peptidase YedK